MLWFALIQGCGASSIPTTSNTNSDLQAQESEEDIVCPEGYAHDGDHCILIDTCSVYPDCRDPK